jgi:hypothetical protein
MAFVHPSKLKECANLLIRLSERLESMRKNISLCPHQPPAKDARYMAFSNCYFMVTTPALVLNWLSKSETGMMSRDVFMKLIDMEEGDASKAKLEIERNEKLGCLVLVLFQLENLLKNILAALGGPSIQGFFKITEELLERVTIGDSKRKHDDLQLTALIRNSLHSNGIYYGYKGVSKSYIIEGVTFDLQAGKRIECAGWGHLYLALDRTLAIIEEILRSPEVQAIKGPIRDDFAWQNATLP